MLSDCLIEGWREFRECLGPVENIRWAKSVLSHLESIVWLSRLMGERERRALAGCLQVAAIDALSLEIQDSEFRIRCLMQMDRLVGLSESERLSLASALLSLPEPPMDPNSLELYDEYVFEYKRGHLDHAIYVRAACTLSSRTSPSLDILQAKRAARQALERLQLRAKSPKALSSS